MARYASGRKALAICDRCGFSYKLRELKELTINDAKTNLLVCPECWETDHPQNRLGKIRVEDFQAIRNPRPDHKELGAVRALRFQLPQAVVIGSVGGVSVSVT